MVKKKQLLEEDKTYEVIYVKMYDIKSHNEIRVTLKENELQQKCWYLNINAELLTYFCKKMT